MKPIRVRWEEVKSVVVMAESEDEAKELAYDHFYEKATLEEQGTIEVIEDDEPVDDERVWKFDDSYGAEDWAKHQAECPICQQEAQNE